MNESIKDKIRKLLAMADGQANENESAVAMKLASRLMMEHGIERDQISAEIAKLKRGEWFDLTWGWINYAAQAAATLYGCMVVTRKGDKKQFQFAGRNENVDAAQDTAAFLILQINALCKAHLPDAKKDPSFDYIAYKRSFKNACAMRVLARAHTIVAEQTQGTGTALVLHRDSLKKEVSDFLSAQAGMGRARNMRTPKIRENIGAVHGRKAAANVDMNRAVQ